MSLGSQPKNSALARRSEPREALGARTYDQGRLVGSQRQGLGYYFSGSRVDSPSEPCLVLHFRPEVRKPHPSRGGTIASQNGRSNQKAKRESGPGNLLPQVQFFDDRSIAVLRSAFKVVKQASAGSNKLEQASTRGVVFTKSLQMISQLIDSSGQ